MRYTNYNLYLYLYLFNCVKLRITTIIKYHDIQVDVI